MAGFDSVTNLQRLKVERVHCIFHEPKMYIRLQSCRVVWCVVGHCDSSECGLIRDLDCWDIEISDYRGSTADTVSDVHLPSVLYVLHSTVSHEKIAYVIDCGWCYSQHIALKTLRIYRFHSKNILALIHTIAL